MNAIKQMMREHRRIEQAIAALQDFCDELQENGGTEKEQLGKFVTFLSTYADRLHHGKEEDILFKAMNNYGFSNQEGPVAAMLVEHDQGRRYIDIMRAAAGHDGDWDDDDREQVFQASMNYAQLLTEHIMKEDEVLYPMSQQALPAGAIEAVDSDCAAFDEDQKAEFQRMEALAAELG